MLAISDRCFGVRAFALRLTALKAALAGKLMRFRCCSRRQRILDLAGEDIADQLAELDGIAGTLKALGYHRASMPLVSLAREGRRVQTVPLPSLPVTSTWLVSTHRWFSSSTGVKMKRDLRPPADAVHAGLRRHDHAHDVRREVQRVPHHAAGACRNAACPTRFFGRDDRQIVRQFGVRAARRG